MRAPSWAGARCSPPGLSLLAPRRCSISSAAVGGLGMGQRWILTAAVAAAACVGLATTARAQAAAEYGLAAGHSAGATAKAATKLGNALNRQNDQTASKLANVRESRMSDNRRGLEAKAGETPAKLHIESTPAKGTVYVDGVAVAYTPADLKLSPGAHRI